MRRLRIYHIVVIFAKKIRSLFTLGLIILLLLGTGAVLKNIFLNRIKKKIQSNFDYSHLHLSLFPPVLVLEDASSRSQSPFFSAKKIAVKIPYKSLLKKEKPFTVIIERPILKIYENSGKKQKEEKRKFSFSFPFPVEDGSIKDGEFSFFGKKISFQSKGINAIFVQRKETLSIRASARENVFSMGPARQKLEGKISLFVERRGDEVTVEKIEFNGSDFSLNVQGSLLDPLNPEVRLNSSFKAKAPLIIDFFQIPFEWEGEAEGKGILTRSKGKMALSADLSSNNLVLNKVFMGKVKGKVYFIENAGQTVELTFQRNSLPREYVRIDIKGKRVEGTVRGAYLDPIIDFYSFPWPVASPADGTFTYEDGKFFADAEFKDEFLDEGPGKFPFRGKAKFSWVKFNQDGKEEISFSSQELVSSFARIEGEGKVVIEQNIDLTIKGEVNDVRQARQFTSLILNKSFDFAEIRGKGEAELRIFGDYDSPQVRAKFSLSPGGFDKFDFYSVDGEAEIIENDVSASFRITDPFMKGNVSLQVNEDGINADVKLTQGLVERILPPLDIDVALEGEASGNFNVKQKNKNVQVKGSFSSPLLKFINQNLSDVKGKLEWEGDLFSLPEIQFGLHKGRISGSVLVQPSSQNFDIDVQGEEVDLSSLYADVKGILAFHLKRKGVLDRNMALGDFEIKDLHYPPLQKTGAKGRAKLGYLEGNLSLELDGSFVPGENAFNVLFAVPVFEDNISVDIRGEINNLDLLLPWKGAKGRVNYMAEIRGKSTSPQIKGAIDFKGPVFPLPKFAHAFRDYSGLMFIENSKVSFRSLKAKLGGGDVLGSGELKLGKDGVENFNIKMEGKNMLLSPLERTRALAEGSLNLIKDTSRFVMEGNILVHRLSWRRELDEKFTFSSSPYYISEKEPGYFDDLTLNIRLKADDDAWMENSLCKIRGRFDLNVTGNAYAPVVTGDISALEGDVFFQDRKFKILTGRLNFFNPLKTEPYISFKGETYVKDYRVTFSLDGLIDQLNPEFSSSPALPPEDVFALLALGESFRRTYSYDRSTQMSTTSLLSFQLSEVAKKGTEGIFAIDRFRIDPFIVESSAEMTARLTVGKKISRNFFILYSTNLATQREDITRLEWELTRDVSIVGIRDENGRISIDVKIYKRF